MIYNNFVYYCYKTNIYIYMNKTLSEIIKNRIRM